MPKTGATQDLGQLPRVQVTHFFLQYHIEFHEQQYADFMGTSVFMLLHALDSDLHESSTIIYRNPSSDADTSENVAGNSRIEKTTGTLVDEFGVVAFKQD